MRSKRLNPDPIMSGNNLYLTTQTLKSYGLHFLAICFALVLFPAENFIHSSSTEASEQKLVLLDFEKDKQLNELGWKCGTNYIRSKEHATSGQFSLKIEMYPQVTWPGFSKIIKNSWVGYDKLTLNIFNPATDPVHISYRIDDRHGNPPYANRANGRFLLKSGANTIRLNLKELKTSDGKRHIDLSKICSFLLFIHQPNKKTTVYMDDLILTKPRPVKRITD